MPDFDRNQDQYIQNSEIMSNTALLPLNKKMLDQLETEEASSDFSGPMKLTKASVSDTDFAIFGSHIATQTEKHDLDKDQQFKILLESTRQSYRNEIRNLH